MITRYWLSLAIVHVNTCALCPLIDGCYDVHSSKPADAYQLRDMCFCLDVQEPRVLQQLIKRLGQQVSTRIGAAGKVQVTASYSAYAEVKVSGTAFSLIVPQIVSCP